MNHCATLLEDSAYHLSGAACSRRRKRQSILSYVRPFVSSFRFRWFAALWLIYPHTDAAMAWTSPISRLPLRFGHRRRLSRRLGRLQCRPPLRCTPGRRGVREKAQSDVTVRRRAAPMTSHCASGFQVVTQMWVRRMQPS